MIARTVFIKFSVVTVGLYLCLFINIVRCEEFTFSLDEASVFDTSGRVAQYLTAGRQTLCNNRAQGGMKYPGFKSDNPLYGIVHVSGRTVESPGMSSYYFVIDESGGTGKGYDRLYIDLNGNRDLTDETPLTAQVNPPNAALMNSSSITQQVCFDTFKMTFDFGQAGGRDIEIMPRLVIRGKQSLFGLIPTQMRKGQIEIDGQKYEAVLGSRYSIGRPFDQGSNFLFLLSEENPQNPVNWTGGETLDAMQFINGKYYGFGATPTGDKLFVRPHEGALGEFKINSSGRDVKTASIQGTLRTAKNVIPIGEIKNGRLSPSDSCRIPEGDYMPGYIGVTFDNITCMVLENRHADGQPYGSSSQQKNYDIKIRKDKPYVFEFSNKPEIIFTSPSKNERITAGRTLQIKAVLTDPKLDVMFRFLRDTNGKTLEPKVVITRASGEKVAEGTMPFG